MLNWPFNDLGMGNDSSSYIAIHVLVLYFAVRCVVDAALSKRQELIIT